METDRLLPTSPHRSHRNSNDDKSPCDEVEEDPLTQELRRHHSVVLSSGSSRYACYVPILLASVGIGIGLLSFVPILIQQRSLHTRLSTAGLPLLGKSKAGKHPEAKAHKIFGSEVLDTNYNCKHDTKYSKHTLKSAYDLPYAALFKDTKSQSKFEASDVTIVNSTVYSVCDSSWAISKFTQDLTPFSEHNVQIGDPDRNPNEDSGYEAIFEHDGLFYVVRESVFHEGHDHDDDDDVYSSVDGDGTRENERGDYHAIIEELDLGTQSYTMVRECQCEFTFEGDSKGFEGAVGFPDVDGQLYILGLCEGNHCSEERKSDVGNGRVVIMKKKEVEDDDSNEECLWETVRVVHIPKSAAFLDYSAIDITPHGRAAIASQEQSSVWLGHANGIENGVIDPDAFEFQDDDDDDTSSVRQFPKDGGCHTIYCNIEGIHFMNDEMLMAVSDKMKSKGRQDFRCFEKDQSIHAFVIP